MPIETQKNTKNIKPISKTESPSKIAKEQAGAKVEQQANKMPMNPRTQRAREAIDSITQKKLIDIVQTNSTMNYMEKQEALNYLKNLKTDSNGVVCDPPIDPGNNMPNNINKKPEIKIPSNTFKPGLNEMSIKTPNNQSKNLPRQTVTNPVQLPSPNKKPQVDTPTQSKNRRIDQNIKPSQTRNKPSFNPNNTDDNGGNQTVFEKSNNQKQQYKGGNDMGMGKQMEGWEKNEKYAKDTATLKKVLALLDFNKEDVKDPLKIMQKIRNSRFSEEDKQASIGILRGKFNSFEMDKIYLETSTNENKDKQDYFNQLGKASFEKWLLEAGGLQ